MATDHAHADVVPVNPDEWVLADGTRLDPFAVTQIGERLYGRGTEDDKNGIVAALFAMRALKDSGLPLRRHFKLLIDTREETGGDAMPYYLERNPTPAYNIALDGSYPVIIAEKGYGTVMARFPARAATGEGAEVVALNGGRPEPMILKDLLQAFISFREEVISRRTRYLLAKARERAHVLVEAHRDFLDDGAPGARRAASRPRSGTSTGRRGWPRRARSIRRRQSRRRRRSASQGAASRSSRRSRASGRRPAPGGRPNRDQRETNRRRRGRPCRRTPAWDSRQVR